VESALPHPLFHFSHRSQQPVGFLPFSRILCFSALGVTGVRVPWWSVGTAWLMLWVSMRAWTRFITRSQRSPGFPVLPVSADVTSPRVLSHSHSTAPSQESVQAELRGGGVFHSVERRASPRC
jgi:hypothetical protein